MGLWDSFLDRFRTAYDLDDLLKASAELLGKGTYGTTYRASMESGVAVVVKRLRDPSGLREEFKAKMGEIGRWDHENLLPLMAYFAGREERLLVYDYFPLGSLSALLHGNGETSELKWETRAKVAVGTARGVEYIHSQGPTICHGSIKSSNIFLSKNHEARVSDFGLATLARDADNKQLAPSQKADVYSFGVFLLELLTGKPPAAEDSSDEDLDLPRWVREVDRLHDRSWYSEVFDVELIKQQQNVEEEMVPLLQLAVDCTGQEPGTRPTMADVTTRIEQVCGFISLKPRKHDMSFKAPPIELGSHIAS